MSQLRVLLYKEWRDQRALVVGSLLLCVLLIAVAKLLGGPRFDPVIRMKYVLPSCLALFAVVLAVESITRDAQKRVEHTLGRLPASRGVVWCAKICFVALSFLGSLAVLAALEQGLRLLEHKPLPPGTPALISTPLLSVIAAAAAACLAAACILKRSLPAAFLGLVLLAAVPCLAFELPPGLLAIDWATVVLCSWTPAAFSVLACGALLLGSLLAFRVRRVDGAWMRRAAAVALGTSIVLVPALAETAREQAWAFDIELFSPRATISEVVPSPDGRFAAIEVEQEWKARDNWSAVICTGSDTGEQTRREVWILDRSTGKCSEIDGRFRWLLGSAWDESGRLVASSSSGTFGCRSFFRDHIDPLTATVVESREVNPARELHPWYWKQTAGTDCVLRWKSAVLRVPKDSLLVPSPQPGVVFQEQDGFLVRHELAPDSTTRLLALGSSGELRFLAPSPDGALLWVNPPHGARRIIDACTGELVHEFQGRDCYAGWSQVPGRICLVWTGEEYSALNEDGSQTPMPARGWGWEQLGLDRPAERGGVIEWGPDRLVAWFPDRIECMNIDGSERQVLYQTRP